RDREAMGLVADPLQQSQRVRSLLEHDRFAPTGHEYLLDSLGQANHRDAPLGERLERPKPGRELALATVDHDQNRQRGEAPGGVRLVRRDVGLLHIAPEAPAEDLLHRGEIIGTSAVLSELAPDAEL